MLVARRQQKLEALKIELEKHYDIQVYIIARDLTEPTAAQDIYDEVT